MNTRLKLKARRRPKRLLPPLSQAWNLALSAGVFVTSLGLFNRGIEFVESRSGVRLMDPILVHMPKANLAFLIFALVYGGLILTLWEHSRSSQQGARLLRAYSILILFRLAALLLTPLEGPEGQLLLRDPVIEFFGGVRTYSHDLFFSGHTATLFLFCCLSRERSHRWVLGLSSAVVGAALLIHRAHYTIDILAAPCFAWSAVALEQWISRVLGIDSHPPR